MQNLTMHQNDQMGKHGGGTVQTPPFSEATLGLVLSFNLDAFSSPSPPPYPPTPTSTLAIVQGLCNAAQICLWPVVRVSQQHHPISSPLVQPKILRSYSLKSLYDILESSQRKATFAVIDT